MNLLIMISNPPFDGVFGGAEIFVKNISLELSKRGYQIHVLCRKQKKTLPEYEKINGVNVHRFSFYRIPKFTWLYTMPRSMFQKGKEIISKFNIDVVYSVELYPVGWVGAKLGEKYGLPVILSLRNVHSYYLNILSNLPFFIRKLVEKRMRWSLNVADRIHAVSNSVKKSYIDVFNLNEKKIDVITNGVDTEKFKPSKNNIKKHNEYYPVIVYPARFDPKQKRHDIVIGAVKILKERYGFNPFTYLIGGGNPDYIHQYIRSSKLEGNFFVGRVSHDEISEIYRLSDICVYPTNYEGFSMALLEVVSSGLPVVATDLPEIREIIDERNGILIKRNDPTLFADAINMLCRDENLLKEMGKNSRKKALEYSWSKIANKVDKMIMKSLERTK